MATKYPAAIEHLPAPMRSMLAASCKRDWSRVTPDGRGGFTVHNTPQRNGLTLEGPDEPDVEIEIPAPRVPPTSQATKTTAKAAKAPARVQAKKLAPKAEGAELKPVKRRASQRIAPKAAKPTRVRAHELAKELGHDTVVMIWYLNLLEQGRVRTPLAFVPDELADAARESVPNPQSRPEPTVREMALAVGLTTDALAATMKSMGYRSALTARVAGEVVDEVFAELLLRKRLLARPRTITKKTPPAKPAKPEPAKPVESAKVAKSSRPGKPTRSGEQTAARKRRADVRQPGQVRIYELARELGVGTRTLLDAVCESDPFATALEYLPADRVEELRRQFPVASPEPEPEPERIKVYELADELDVTSKTIQSTVVSLGGPRMQPSSWIEAGLAQQVRHSLRPDSAPAPEAPVDEAPVDEAPAAAVPSGPMPAPERRKARDSFAADLTERLEQLRQRKPGSPKVTKKAAAKKAAAAVRPPREVSGPRVLELAQDLGVETGALMRTLRDLGHRLPPLARVSPDLEARCRELAALAAAEPAPQPEPAAPEPEPVPAPKPAPEPVPPAPAAPAAEPQESGLDLDEVAQKLREAGLTVNAKPTPKDLAPKDPTSFKRVELPPAVPNPARNGFNGVTPDGRVYTPRKQTPKQPQPAPEARPAAPAPSPAPAAAKAAPAKAATSVMRTRGQSLLAAYDIAPLEQQRAEAVPVEWAATEEGLTIWATYVRAKDGIPQKVPVLFRDDVSALYGVDLELLEDIVRRPERCEIDASSTQRGYATLKYWRGDVMSVVGFRDPYRPMIIAAYVNNIALAQYMSKNPTGGGGGARKAQGLPTRPQKVVERLRDLGAVIDWTPNDNVDTVEVTYQQQSVGKINVGPVYTKTTCEQDFQRTQRRMAAIDRAGQASLNGGRR